MIEQTHGPSLLIDLDGTLTAKELLPEIAALIGVQKEMRRLTAEAMAGIVPFEQSFRSRVARLSGIDLVEVQEHVRSVPLRAQLLEVARRWPFHVEVVTSNLDCWIEKLMADIGLPYQSSVATVTANGTVDALASILDKAAAVREAPSPTIYIGDGANDAPALAVADISIAFAPNRRIPKALLEVADFVFVSEVDLCRFLRRWSLMLRAVGVASA